MFRHIAARYVPFEWERLALLLAPAVRADPGATMQGLYRKLAAGQAAVLDVTMPTARGVLIIETVEDDGMVCWITHLAGSVDGGPKKWLATMRAEMAGFERIAKAAGYRQIRICGRNWRRVFDSYRVHDDATNELRKDLT